jgi:hypothetical protein
MSSESQAGRLIGTVPIREGQTELRVTLHEWRGRRFVDLRKWERFTNELGPTKQGARFAADLLEELIPVLEAAARAK